MLRWLGSGLFVTGLLAVVTAQQRPPVFRAGAHYVRVDAYPTAKDGKIVEGLTRDDFEIDEDGAPQTIENIEYITFDRWTPEAERKDPRTAEEGYGLAADPRYRVFVVVIDRAAFDMVGWNVTHGPLEDFLERTLGPHDLFGLLSSKSEWTDLVLGQKTTAIRRELEKPEWWTTSDRPDDKERALISCGLESLIPRLRADETYSLLEGLVRLMGAIREERKSIVYVANGLPNSGAVRMTSSGGTPAIPKVGVTGGRLGPMPRDGIPGGVTASFCSLEKQRLMSLDFDERFRDLLKSARQSNVSFYPVSPIGLQGIEFTREGAADMNGFRRQRAQTDLLRSLASETDGVAIVNTNDLRGGLQRIADGLQAYYVLGYYTTNTTWDGGIRSIKVRLKPKRDTIRARRQYRAPTPAEIAALTASASPAVTVPPSGEERALARLLTSRPSAPFWASAALAGQDLAIVLEIPGDAAGASRWPAGADVQATAETVDGEVIGTARERVAAGARGLVLHVPLEARGRAAAALVRVRAEGTVLTERLAVLPASTLVGDPLAYRNGSPAVFLSCDRSDRLRIEWPLLAPLDRRAARVLDRKGQPLPIALPVSENELGSRRVLVTELPLAPLARGEYLIELVASGAGATERKLLALRVR